MKKYFLILFFIFSSLLFAEENESKFSVSSQFGIMNGVIGEHLYDDYCLNTDNQISYLNWEILNIPVLSFNFDYNVYKNLFFGANFTFGFPQKSGNMQDYDWLNSCISNYPEWHNDNPYELTNYSIHDNKVSEYFNSDFSIGYLWQISKNNLLMPYFQFSFNHIMFEGTNGYSNYKWDNFNKVNFKGKVISYIVNSNSFFMGLCYKNNVHPFISLKIDFCFSPMLCFLKCFDYHWEGRKLYFDKIPNASEYKGSITVDFKINNKNKFGYWANVDFIPLEKGKEGTKKINSKGKITSSEWVWSYNQLGGFDKLTWSFGIKYCLSL